MTDVTARVEELKMICREEDVPFFSDAELLYQLERADGNIELAAYNCLCIKAEDTTLTINGLTTADSSKYFRRMASRYRPTNSGILMGDN